MARPLREPLSARIASERPGAPQPGLGFFMREAYRAFARELDRRLARHGITHAQWVMLYFLDRAGTTTPVGLSRAAGIRKASATSAIEALRSRGLILAERDSSDGRKLNLSLSPRGNALMRQLRACAADANLKAHGALKPREVSHLIATLQKVTANLERDGL